MSQPTDLRREREYTAKVQQLLMAMIQQYKGYNQYHDENIRQMLSDAWDELRMKPTALSPQDLQQLSAEIDHVLARRAFSADLVRRYERMVLEPFFARVDFAEPEQKRPDKIVIGLYSLKDPKGRILVHDWRAPVCSLYYDAMPGPASYQSPSGLIEGRLTRKRQYRMERGRLEYYVDTDVSIGDGLLLDILSRATSTHMRSIVSTIQKEQNAAIRQEKARVLSVVGGAGSGKTSVAMHRAAYLMYHQRSLLEASRLAVLSPGSAFSEYISTVLPDLGEENVQALTLRQALTHALGKPCEAPLKQAERLLEGDALRLESVSFKGGASFVEFLDRFCLDFWARGPAMETLTLGKNVLAGKAELERLYRVEFRMLSPALRLVRLKTVLTQRLERWEQSLHKQYESRLVGSYRGRELDMAARLAVSQQLQPLRAQIRRMLEPDPLALFAQAMAAAPQALAQAAQENAQAGLIWWEDAPAVAYLLLKLGFVQPDRRILHLLIDEAQDYSGAALSTLRLYYPRAHVTLLGDPNQRTCPGMPPCQPQQWGACFGEPDAPIIHLSKCYRSTLPITRLCNALLPLDAKSQEFGREGQFPLMQPYSEQALLDSVAQWRGQPGMRTIAVITRSQAQALALAKRLAGCVLLTGEDGDVLPEDGGLVVGSYQVMKGLEFDAVAVVWPACPLTEDERRRLYTACSRALHALCFFADPQLIRDLAIVI